LPVAANLLKGRFQTDKTNKVWLSDITYIRTQEGWLYIYLSLGHPGFI
jgi:putative transposase